MSDLKNIRTDYQVGNLNEADLSDSPIDLFQIWMDKAVEVVKKDANAFVLSTINKKGFPSSRVVLLRGIDDGSFCFFTNYTSNKASNLEEKNQVAMNFFWPALERQIRVEGIIERTSSKYSDDYFQSRPYSSKIGAWASNQSSVIKTRTELEERVSFYENKFPVDVPRPDFWGGYKIIPSAIEFWQGRSNRLHDRFVYNQQKKDWKIDRLSP